MCRNHWTEWKWKEYIIKPYCKNSCSRFRRNNYKWENCQCSRTGYGIPSRFINEISEAGSYDCGCVVSGAKSTFTNETGLISLLTDENGEQAIRLNAPFIATEPNGTKHTFKDAITANLVNIGVKAGRNYSLYLSLSADELGNVGKLVALEGLEQ